MHAALELTESNPLSKLRFLELSVPAANVLNSLTFFQQLGFTSIHTNDIWNYPYGVISDGRCFIGLHDANHYQVTGEHPRLSFVHEHVAPLLNGLQDSDFSVLHAETDEDRFQHASLKGIDNIPLHIMAARSFSPPSGHQRKDSLLGYFRGVVLLTANLHKAEKFWNDVGLLVMPIEEEQCLMVSSNRLNMLLLEKNASDQCGLLFEHPQPESLFAQFARFGITLKVGEDDLVLGSEYQFRTPDGMPIWIRREA
ncbi:MAG: hypothetical protein HKN88_00350 [Gammaproteobacteria bacterium]|nr:hypothetical protein [Gammaproteobacteria bacterium]NNC96500.1 hypothetical protein [Gammaproteobacteria bacterium]NNM14716.1 hypothetical protein [Gammaproteobacteria bacterium]